MTIVEAVKSVLRQYVGFKGRAQRSEFWWWVLFDRGFLLSLIALSILFMVLGFGGLGGACRGFAWLVDLLLLLPSLAVGARRLHDAALSAWWLLLLLIPLLGLIALILLWCQKGTAGLNRFGADPLTPGPDVTVFGASPAA